MRIWRPLADQGDAEAQFRIGTMYANATGKGKGLPLDYCDCGELPKGG
jgi:TPR repeat protein